MSYYRSAYEVTGAGAEFSREEIAPARRNTDPFSAQRFFGLVNKPYKLAGVKISARSLLDVLVGCGYNVILVPLPKYTTPRIVVVPDEAIDQPWSNLGITRTNAYLLSLSAFMALQNKEMIQLISSELSVNTTSVLRRLTHCCLSGSLLYRKYFLPHEFIRNMLIEANWLIREDCVQLDRAVMVGDFNQAKTLGEHVDHLTVDEFVMLQPRSFLPVLNQIFEKGLLWVAENHKHLPSYKVQKTKTVIEKPIQKSAQKKATNSKKKATSKKSNSTKKQATKKKATVHGRAEFDSNSSSFNDSVVMW